MLSLPEIGGAAGVFYNSWSERLDRNLEMQLKSQLFFLGGGWRSFILLPNRPLPSNSFFRPKSNSKIAITKTKGAFQKSELAGRTMTGPVILTMKSAFSKSFCWKTISFVHAIQDFIAGSGWTVLIKSEIFVTTGMAERVTEFWQMESALKNATIKFFSPFFALSFPLTGVIFELIGRKNPSFLVHFHPNGCKFHYIGSFEKSTRYIKFSITF